MKFLLLLFFPLLFLLTACQPEGVSSGSTDGSESTSMKTEPETPSYFAGLSVELDGGYTLAFDPETTSYTVALPLGHPRVPLVLATEDETISSVVVTQAALPEDEAVGEATVEARRGSETRTYTIRFEKTASAGFALQYDDFYTFTPNYSLQSGESFTFSSDNTSAISTDESGVLRAVGVTDSPVTVTASVNGDVKASLTVSRVERAVVNLFLVTGQSNAVGCYDLGRSGVEGQWTLAEQLAAVIRPENRGQVYGYTATVAKYTPVTAMSTFPYNTLYDMNEHAVNGFLSPLGATFYNKTGEKVVFLQTSRDGSAIEAWIPSADGGGTWKSYSNKNLYDEAYKNYTLLLSKLDSQKFEIRRTHNYWLQGETNMLGIYDYATGNWGGTGERITYDEYYDAFMKIKNAMARDMGVSFQGIVLARTRDNSVTVNDVRAAQYALANASSDIAVVSRTCDIATMVSHADTQNPGWGMMGVDNVHYNQNGHNANGLNAAEATFLHLFSGKESSKIVLLDQNGKETLTNGSEITCKKGESYRLTGYITPDGRDTSLFYESSDKAVAKIDAFGNIDAKAVGSCTITLYTDTDLSVEVTLRVTE